jgi:nitroreductase/NAD-dependent dihydropyrimidine dehydrogenase PreA subunit
MTTILVNQDLCTRCGICAIVCPMGIVSPAGENTLPKVPDEKAGACIRCGHCEIHCPSQALLLNCLIDEKGTLPAGAGVISKEDLGPYLKKRRSVRHFTKELVPQETVAGILDVARYAASGGNGQPVGWLVILDPKKVHRLAGLVVDWMRTLENSSHPMSGYVPGLIAAWDAGMDPVCRGAPHLVVAHIPEGNPIAPVDAIIALTHFDIAAPAFGVGACWAGFFSMAARSYEPLKEALALPPGREYSYSLFFGYPQYKTYGIPRRNPVLVEWR